MGVGLEKIVKKWVAFSVVVSFAYTGCASRQKLPFELTSAERQGIDDVCMRAREAFKAGLYKKAIAELEQGLQVVNASPWAFPDYHALRRDIYFQLAQCAPIPAPVDEQAIRDGDSIKISLYEKALDSARLANATDAASLLREGEILWHSYLLGMERPDAGARAGQALNAFTKSIKADPHCPDAYVLRGSLLAHLAMLAGNEKKTPEGIGAQELGYRKALADYCIAQIASRQRAFANPCLATDLRLGIAEVSRALPEKVRQEIEQGAKLPQ
jgi:tetratricopeptide (TPR) repeat protein